MTEHGAGTAAQSATGDLLDVNVWLALAIEEHPHHRVAASYWSSHAKTPRFFCRVSAMSLVRLLAHPKLMADRPLTLAKAWALYRSFVTLPGIAMLREAERLDGTLAALITPRLSPRLFTDAYFAALALSAGLRLVTFDRDFQRFERLSLLRLTAEPH